MTEQPEPRDEPKPRSRRGEPEPFQRQGDDRWTLAVELPPKAGKRQRRWVYGSSPAEVRRKARVLRHELDSGNLPPDEHTSLRVWYERWHERRRPDGGIEPKAPRTWVVEGQMVERLVLPYLGRTAVGRIRKSTVIEWLDELAAASVGLASRRSAHAILRKILADAESRGLINRNPALDAGPGYKRETLKVWDVEHAQRFLLELNGDPDQTLYLFLANLALRPAEALGLTWDCVDWADSTLTIRGAITHWGKSSYIKDTKTEAGVRTLPLTPDLLAALKRRQAAQDAEKAKAGAAWRDNNLVFANPDGTARRVDTLSHQFARRLVKLGLPHCRLYDLRHLGITLMLRATGDLNAARAFAGHSSQRLVGDVYGHLLPSVARPAAADVADRLAVGLAVKEQDVAPAEPDPSTPADIAQR